MQRKEDLAHAHEPAITLDGTRIEIVANIGGLKDAVQIAGFGGEGVGLLRSEFLFMERNSAPSEDEQFEAYKAIAQAVGMRSRSSSARSMSAATNRSLICRSRKRTIRSSANAACASALDRPDILRAQLRAILRASKFGKVSVMFPMISTLAGTARRESAFCRRSERSSACRRFPTASWWKCRRPR